MRNASDGAASPAGATAALRRSRLVLGSADLRDDSVTQRLLDQFYDAGGRSLDTANVYADGESGRAIGTWLGARGGGRSVTLYAKGCHPPYCRPELVSREVEIARSSLGVDRIDVFLLHRDDPGVSVESFADALLEQVAAQNIAAFGVSNWTAARFDELRSYLARIGDGHLAAYSNHFSLGEMVTPTWPGCLGATKAEAVSIAGSGVRFLAWASLAMGYFAWREAPSWESAENEARRRRAVELAGALRTTPNAIALSYVLHQPDHVYAVVGTRSSAHLAEALSACDLDLTTGDLVALESGAPG
jgi:aryl-alcohol dehydrogenase-like predicted oxidoreductase